MFRITGQKQNVNVKECIASSASELPDKDECYKQSIGLGSECFVIDTSDVYVLNDDYVWTVV